MCYRCTSDGGDADDAATNYGIMFLLSPLKSTIISQATEEAAGGKRPTESVAESFVGTKSSHHNNNRNSSFSIEACDEGELF